MNQATICKISLLMINFMKCFGLICLSNRLTYVTRHHLNSNWFNVCKNNFQSKMQCKTLMIKNALDQCFSTFFKSRNLSKISNHLAEPKCSIQYYLQHFQGTQQELIGGTSGFRGTQVEKHCLRQLNSFATCHVLRSRTC